MPENTPPVASAGSAPVRLEFTAGHGHARFVTPSLPPGRYGIHVTFGLGDYTIERHCCYARHHSSPAPSDRRFVDMEFAPAPPGIAVGPWPGWRGIPPMPEVTLHWAGGQADGRYNFWGDERDRGVVRLFFLLDAKRAGVMSVELRWAERRWHPQTIELYPGAKPRATPQPLALPAARIARHPRLLFGPDKLAALRARRHSTHQAQWQAIEALLANWELPFSVTSESKTPPGPERLHAMDRVILAACHALITETPASQARAREALLAFLAQTEQPDYEPMLIDTQAGECLFTLSLACDWLWPGLDATLRAELQSRLFAVAGRVWTHLGTERDDYAQAHFLGCAHGLLAFALLFWSEHPQAATWAAHIRGAFDRVQQMLPADGFFPHGINLWIYEHTFLLRLLELFDEDGLWQHPYWRQASRFRAAALSPDGRLGVTFGDPQFRVAGDAWLHYLIAARTGSAGAQWLGQRLAPLATTGVDFRSVPPRRRVWEYLYFDPALTAHPDDLSTLFFADGGQVFWRSTAGGTETLLTLRAGAPLGRQRHRAGEWSGYGHSDPNHGSFLLARDDRLLLCGSGPVYRRDTLLNNTITIDGRGQIGDSAPWAPEFVPANRFARLAPLAVDAPLEAVEADLTAAYLDHLGVRRLLRRCYFARPGLVVLHDRIALAQARELQWNLHTYGEIVALPTKAGLGFRIADGNQTLQLFCLLPRKVAWRSGLTDFVPAYPHGGERDRFLQLHTHAAAADFVVLLVLEGTETQWRMRRRGHADWTLEITIGGTTMRVNG